VKPALHILLSLVFVSIASAEKLTLHCSYDLGVKDQVRFQISRDELEKVPAWEPADGTRVRLSRNQALEIARNAVSLDGLDVSDESKLTVTLRTTNRFEKELLKHLPPRCCRWFYLVQFRGDDVDLKEKFTVLVTMSGATATKETVTSR
jgi:hypothetical protein